MTGQEHETSLDHEVWYGRQWCPARVTERRYNGEVRAVVPSAGTAREMRFGKHEVRPASPESRGASHG